MSVQTWRKVRWICTLTGAWGVLTGYPLFVLISEKSDALEGSSVILQFFGVLLTALVVVMLTEWLRETIRGEQKKQSVGAILISILLLAIFEVFVIAYEEVSQVGFESPYVLSDIAARVSGQQTPYAFLNADDITNPNAILERLRDGLGRPETSAPEAWIISDFARETRWTFLAALVLAFAVYGATAVAQKATFHGVLGNVHDLSVRGGSDINLWSKTPETPSFTGYGQLLARLTESRFTGDLPLDQVVDTLEEQHSDRLQQERTKTARRLELSIVGSLGFWLTVGLLAAWAVVRPPARHDGPHPS